MSARTFHKRSLFREDGEVRDYLRDVRSVFHFPAVTSDASQKYQDNLFSSAHPVMDPNPQSQHGQFQTSDLRAVSSLWEARMTALSSPAGQTSLTCSWSGSKHWGPLPSPLWLVMGWNSFSELWSRPVRCSVLMHFCLLTFSYEVIKFCPKLASFMAVICTEKEMFRLAVDRVVC